MKTQVGRVARALVGRRWWWVTLLVLALMVLLARLGFWQLDRLAQRREANAQLQAAIESAPIDLNAALAEYARLAPDEVEAGLANRNVVMHGAYNFSQQRVVKLQSWQGQAGVHLITPFVLEGTDTAVLVNRGWIPDAEHAAGLTFDTPGGRQTLTGYVALTETISRRTADAVVPATLGEELFRVDVAALGEEMPFALLPFYVKLDALEGTAVQLPVPIPKEVDLSEGPHLSYAAQWFIFSLGLGIAYVVFVNRSLAQADRQAPAESAAV